MGKRKRNVSFMKLLLNIHNGVTKDSTFSTDDKDLIQELTALGYLNSSAFALMKRGSEIYKCAMTGEYPLTAKGEEYMDMGRYQALRQSSKYQLVRDIAAFIGAAAGLVIGIIKIICG
ncbi:MAG: hypothetical protein A2176_03490 [Spirochaetes bacterium RBG_13_51_14]|nr:MAG: hypothetical protein A2176_03490 [Spirochaetes bacterium RBG_13_51_14]